MLHDAQVPLDLESEWTSAEKRAVEAACLLKEAIQTLQDGGSARLLSTRRPATKMLLDKLLCASALLRQFMGQLSGLKGANETLHEKLRATAGVHTEVLHQVEGLSSGLKVRVGKPEDNQLASETETLRLELAKLKQDFGVLKKEKEDKAAALGLAEESKNCALDQVERHKEVIARTTADNMLFLMKLKQTEDQLQACTAKQEELQAQLQRCKSSWLEEASAEVEDAVKGSLDKVEACELELQAVRKKQELTVVELQQKLQDVVSQLGQASSAKRSLEERLKRLEEERDALRGNADRQAMERQKVEINSRMLASTADKSNKELVRLRAEHARVVNELTEKDQRLSRWSDKEQELAASVASISSQLETQRAINSALMRKKEEVEWLCLEAQAEREKVKQQLKGLLAGV